MTIIRRNNIPMLLLRQLTLLVCISSLLFVHAAAAYQCPAGYDCAKRNSCPSVSVTCPLGWFCGSLLGHPQQAIVDAAWTSLLRRNSRDSVAPPLPASRWFEGQCIAGFYCPDTTTMVRCPAGSWCMAGVAAPRLCDSPAACAEGATYQVSFVLPIVFLAASALICGASYLLIYLQQRAETASRKLQTSGDVAPSNKSSSAAGETLTLAGTETSGESPVNEDGGGGGGLAFEFFDLTLSINGCNILRGVSGRAPAASITAVMGPSGCGKTTLMNTLRGRPPSGAELTGVVHITVEGEVGSGAAGGGKGSSSAALVPPHALPSLLGFAPQDDVMDRSLTVRELFTHSAKVRLPRDTMPSHVSSVVDATIRDLALDGVADVVVGGSENAAANISGGQLKRVSIGVELVARPLAIFLDEPTSGLDATAALDLMVCLRRICFERRIAVFCVLHQPRAEAFACVDNLLLLASDGRVAYEGDASACVPWLKSVHVQSGGDPERGLARGMNPADFIIDRVTCKPPPQLSQGPEGQVLEADGDDIAALWQRSHGWVTSPFDPGNAEFVPPTPAASFFRQAQLSAERAMLSRLRSARTLAFFVLLHVSMAAALSPGFSPLIQNRYQFSGPLEPMFVSFVPPLVRDYASTGGIQDMAVQQMCFFMTIACGAAGGILAIGAFGPLRPTIQRDAEAGANLVAVGIGRMLADLLVLLWCALGFSAAWMLFGHFGRPWMWFGVITGCLFASSGFGHAASLITRPINAAVILFVFVIIEAVFSGIEPHLAQVRMFPVLNLVWLLSFGSYVAQGVYGIYTEPLRGVSDVDTAAQKFGFDVTNEGVRNSILSLIGIGLLWRAVALALLYRQQRLARGGSSGAGLAPSSKTTTKRTAVAAVPVSHFALQLIPFAAAATAAGATSTDVSPACASAAAATLAADANPCAQALASLLLTSGGLASCTDDGACIADSYLASVASGNTLLLSNDGRSDVASSSGGGAPSCALCGDANFVPDDCVAAAASLVSGIRTGSGALATSCASAEDALALTLLRDQSAVVCTRAERSAFLPTAGYTSLAGLSQCSACGIQQCSPGMVCAEDTTPAQCPPGSFCPDGLNVFPCPAGSYCPVGSTEPIACRALASGSCGSGASREVVWVPLLLAILFTAILQGVIVALERRRLATAPKRGVQLVPKHDVDASIDDVSRARGLQSSEPRIGVSIAFSALTLTTKGVKRLDDISGRLLPGRVAAILGGSGAGKTTLMNSLLGKEVLTGGTVNMSAIRLGEKDSVANSVPELSSTSPPAAVALTMDDLRLSLGFVPQMDVLIRELSLRESILHSALTRLPRSVSRAEAAARVDELIGGLNLSRVADLLVGETSGSARGVSGGERKRLSIAVELVADPLVLFLDEPTTGLDATTALSAMVALRSLAQQRGLTCFAVIHQPRQEIVEAIDDIILLGRGGRPIFLGPRDLAIPYVCDALGYELPELCSPADFLLDVANGKHGLPRLEPATGAGSDGSKGDAEPQVARASKYLSGNNYANPGVVAVVEALATAWRSGGERWVQQRSSIVPYSNLDTAHDASAELWSKEIREKLRKPRRNTLEQILLHALRATRQRFRGTSLMIDLFSMLLGGFVAGIVLSGGDLIIPNAPLQYFQSCPPSGSVFCKSPLRRMYQPATFYITMIFAVLSIAPAVRLFGAEREVAWREAGVGIPAGSYFLGKLLAELPVWALMALNVSAPLAAVAPLRGPYGGFFSLAMATIVFCSSLGTAISAIFGTDSDKANLTGVILATVLNLAGGFVPMLGKGAVWAYTHWTARAFVAIELNAGYGIAEPMFRWITNDEWAIPNWPRDIGVICLFSVLTFALAFVISVTFHIDKRR